MVLKRASLLFAFSLVVYATFSRKYFFAQSHAPNYVYLANLFNQGRVIFDKPYAVEMFPVAGGATTAAPLFPAVLMMPFIWVWGLAFNDVIFTILIGALNVTLTYLLLRRYAQDVLSEEQILWLTFLFGFGSVHFYSAIYGTVWFTAHIVCVTLTILYLYCLKDLAHPFWAGVCFACSVFSRTPAVMSIFYFGYLVFQRGAKRTLKEIVLFLIPTILIAVLGMEYNFVRFLNPLEFGHRFVSGHQDFPSFINLRYVGANLYNLLFRPPVLMEKFPYVVYNDLGMSLFIISPAFLWLFYPTRLDAQRAALFVTAALIALPGLMHYAGGFGQLGPRFVLDYVSYLMILLAASVKRHWSLFKAFILVSIAFNAYGAVLWSVQNRNLHALF